MRRAGLLLLTALSACTHLERRGGEADLAVCFVATPDLSLDAWNVTEPGAWSVVETEDGAWIELAPAEGGFAYQPPHRSPHRIALLQDLEVDG